VDRNGKADFETYLRRIGQTGRFGKSGVVVNLVNDDRSMAVLNEIVDHFRKLLKLIVA